MRISLWVWLLEAKEGGVGRLIIPTMLTSLTDRYYHALRTYHSLLNNLRGDERMTAAAATTLVYKTYTGGSICADLYLPPAANATAKTPVIMFIHGGALIWGSKAAMYAWEREALLAEGFAVVSIDYRLAPESRLAQIIGDIRDALSWVRASLPMDYPVDPDRIGVMGASAGGYLGLMCGTFLPRPQAIVSLYGYGDILGDWYGRPSEFYCSLGKVDEADARRLIGSRPLSEGGRDRFGYYLYLRQNGLWTSAVSGLDSEQSSSILKAYCPAYLVDRQFPPTLLLHGDADTDVPYAQSLQMYQALRASGVKCDLITLPGRGHAFDREPGSGDIQAAFAKCVAFLRTHVRGVAV